MGYNSPFHDYLFGIFWQYLGEECHIKFATCACEPLVLTMVRARLWPSSPQRPHFAFAFELLDWTEALLLEAQVSVHDFCKALYFKCSNRMAKVSRPTVV